METPFGANIGQVLQAQVNAQEQAASTVVVPEPEPQAATPEVQTAVAPAPVKQDTNLNTLVFCAIGMLKVQPSRAGFCFPERPEKGKVVDTLKGWLIVGPAETDGAELPFNRFADSLRGYRWCLNQGKLYYVKGGVQVWQRGSITEDETVNVACKNPKCQWKDLLTSHDVHAMREARLGCPMCGSNFMSRHKPTSVFPTSRADTDPICQGRDDEMVAAMHVSMHEQERKPSLLLPRFYAVYRADEKPFDWEPQDQKAKALADRFKPADRIIRPIREARMKYEQDLAAKRRTHIEEFVVEAHAGVRFGWVTISDLMPKSVEGDGLFTRSFGWTTTQGSGKHIRFV